MRLSIFLLNILIDICLSRYAFLFVNFLNVNLVLISIIALV